MKLRKRIAICFAIVIIVPVTLAAATLAGTLYFQADAIRQHYGIDVAHLEAFDKSMVFSLIFSILVILIIGGLSLVLCTFVGVLIMRGMHVEDFFCRYISWSKLDSGFLFLCVMGSSIIMTEINLCSCVLRHCRLLEGRK